MKTIEKSKLTEDEKLEMVLAGKNPQDFIALDIVAMGMNLTEHRARVKESEGSENTHNCLICTIPFPLPLDTSILNQKKLIVPSINGQQSGSLEIALGGIPKIRLLIKKDAVVDTLKQDKEQ